MLTLATTYTFNELMESAYRGAEDVLRVIAEHHKTEEFKQLVKDLGYEPIPPKIIINILLYHTKADALKILQNHENTSGFRALNDWLADKCDEVYNLLDIPTDEDGEPLPYEE